LVDVEARERAVLALLDEWPWDAGGVLIGGYAISAYGPPRYSVDVDVVIPAESAPGIRSWLRKVGFELTAHAVPNPQNYEGQVERFLSKAVTLDLLAGAVRDREAMVDIPEKWISKSCRRMVLETLSGKTSHPIPIARPEALWALKLQSGRDLDLTDLFAISNQPADLDDVRQLFEQLATDSLSRKLQSVRSKLGDRRLFEDSLSRRQLGSPDSPQNVKRWQRFISRVESIVGPVARAGPAGTR
jgi:hypothetical protein